MTHVCFTAVCQPQLRFLPFCIAVVILVRSVKGECRFSRHLSLMHRMTRYGTVFFYQLNRLYSRKQLGNYRSANNTDIWNGLLWLFSTQYESDDWHCLLRGWACEGGRMIYSILLLSKRLMTFFLFCHVCFPVFCYSGKSLYSAKILSFILPCSSNIFI